MGSLGLRVYHDSSWGKDTHSSFRWVGRYAQQWGNQSIQWGSRKLRIVPDSTAEAETTISSRAAKETVAIRMVLKDLRVCVQGPTPILGDCKAVKDIITKPCSTHRTRYFEHATLLVKRLYMLRIVVSLLIRTDDITADIFTEALPREQNSESACSIKIATANR